MAENQELVGGRYRILGRLGKGAMGVVFMAHDPVLDRKVAIKQMTAEIARNEDLRQRFYVEARAAARLNHPHIITVHELQESDGEIYMVMELLEGKALASLIEERQGPLPLETTLDLIAQVCDGLEYAHQHAIVHRDIKPANIFVASSGVVKILDFGIARLGSLHMTATGALVGTPDYMSPEQVRGDEIDRRTDLWAVGAVLYQMLSGTKPFDAKPLAKLLMAITQTPHVPLQQRAPSVPRSACDLVDRLLAKPRDGRPATAALVRDELRAILGRDSMVKPAVEVAEEYGETLVVVPGTRAGGAPVPAVAAASGSRSEVGTAETVAPTAPHPMPPPVPPTVPRPVPAAPPAVPTVAPPAVPAAVAGAAAPAVPTPASAAPAAAVRAASVAAPEAVPARPRARLGLVVAVLAIFVVLGAAVVGGAAWWFMGPRLLELAGLRQAAPAATTTPATGQAAAVATEPAASAATPAATGNPPATPSQAASGAAEEAPPAFVPPPAQATGEALPTQAAAPSMARAQPGEPRDRGQATVEREAPSTPPPSHSGPARGAAAAPPARPADAPSTHTDEPAVTAPRVTDKLTEDTVATLSGQRSQSSYGGGASGSAVAAVNRITWVLQQYAAALQRRDADGLRRHRPSPGPVETQWLGARELSVRLENLAIEVNGTSAVARCRRTVEGTLASGAPVRESRNVAFGLTRQPTGWIITDVR